MRIVLKVRGKGSKGDVGRAGNEWDEVYDADQLILPADVGKRCNRRRTRVKT